MRRLGPASNWFILQVLLLSLPLLVLLGLGLHLLRQDKSSVEKEAREHAEKIARQTLADLARVRNEHDPAPYLQLTNRWPEGTAFIQITTNSELFFPPTVQTNSQSDSLLLLSSTQSNLWLQAQRAEYETNDFPAATQFWNELLDSEPPKPLRPLVLLQQAILSERSGEFDKADLALVGLAGAPLDARLESGIPVASLASAKLWQSALARGLPDAPQKASFCISNLLARPSEFTLQLLHAGLRTTLAPAFAQAQESWRQQEEARRLYQALIQSQSGHPLLDDPDATLRFNDTDWAVHRSGTNLFLISTRRLALASEESLQRVASTLPEYVALAFLLANRTFFLSQTNLAARPPLWSRVAEDRLLQCELYLTNPSALYARQRQRARLFGSFLGLAGAFGAFGIVYAGRNYRKQQRLNELKSNFVSSVTHELRAPLASMRLMSEGLQSGRVRDPEKQREYFSYLLQECRRLSALVENVLDFSRIDQGRKSYHLEKCELLPLCRRALQTVAPIANERGVRLLLDPDGDTQASDAFVDPLALQQAMVNLLDNAIKHSPPGESVQLRLLDSPQEISISVQDNGPGIDPSEHQRIFERFYRIGPELRRETQGVGIGLSIVKHIIESHHGTVLVQSSPGAGATFVLCLPKDTDAKTP